MGGGNYNLIRLGSYVYYKTITTISDLNGNITPGYNSWNGINPDTVRFEGAIWQVYYRISCQNNTNSKTDYYENRLFDSNKPQDKNFVNDGNNGRYSNMSRVFRPIIEFKE